jgi:histidyl-tRNA synthetase
MYYFGSCFRYERPQAGRFRQFWQFGVEVIGGTPVYNEAEIIAMANETLKRLKIRNYEVAIGHLGIIKGVLNHLDITPEKQTEIIASIDKEDYELLDEILTNCNVDDEYKETINSIINVNGSHDDLNSIRDLFEDIPESMEALAQLDEILTVVEAFGFDDYTVKLSIARGLDYYTGVVFEIYVPDLGAQKQITGGGTYNLTSLFDSEDVESTGFAFGFDRIMEAFHKQKLEVEEENCNKVLVVPVKKEFKIEAIKVAQILRDADIITDIDLKGKKLKKNLSFANANNINNVVLIGQKEIEEDTVTLKHMDTKEQVSIPRSQLVENILNN